MALLEARLGTVGFSQKDSVSVHSQVPKPRSFPGAREGLPVAPLRMERQEDDQERGRKLCPPC